MPRLATRTGLATPTPSRAFKTNSARGLSAQLTQDGESVSHMLSLIVRDAMVTGVPSYLRHTQYIEAPRLFLSSEWFDVFLVAHKMRLVLHDVVQHWHWLLTRELLHQIVRSGKDSIATILGHARTDGIDPDLLRTSSRDSTTVMASTAALVPV